MGPVNHDNQSLKPYLSPLGAWALSFGCAVGWGSFVMPGTTFLPIAGPAGTLLGIVIGALVMLLVGVNYHYMMMHYPSTGGAFIYTKETLGYDHGFLNAWFLLLTYIAILWANATALPLIARYLLGSFFRFGWHYQIAGFQIYFGEVMLAVGSILAGALICLRNRLAARFQIVMAITLFAGVAVAFFVVFANRDSESVIPSPMFSGNGSHFSQVFSIVALTPWAFVGFESISHAAGEFRFSHRKSWAVMAASVAAAAVSYAALSFIAAYAQPEGFASWQAYINELENLPGAQGLPTLFVFHRVMGRYGSLLFGVITLAAIGTGLVGNYIAVSRLIYSMSKEGIFPPGLSRLGKHHTPSRALVFIFAVSVLIPFLGRTAISWIVDVTTVGATISYGYTSLSAMKTARKERKIFYEVTGGLGLAVSIVLSLYFLVPSLLIVSTLSTESYLILSVWCILGFLFFRFIFMKDKLGRYGHTTKVWMVMLGLIFFTSLVWMRQASLAAIERGMEPIQDYYEKTQDENTDIETDSINSSKVYLDQVFDNVKQALTLNIVVQTGLIVSALGVLFSMYSILQKREKQMEVEKAIAEESSRAKTSFLSNMSHEIRTPMNAIIGLGNIALKDPDLNPRTRDQLEKISSSARHLLGLINDILDMSRIESGRMTLKEDEFFFREFLDQINVIILGQCSDKGLTYESQIIGKMEDYYIGDALKLKQVLINILGNSVKFTDAPGTVTLTVEELSHYEEYCTLRFEMKDTGIGISKEYLPRIFESFSQEDSSSTNRYGSSGLGMAITKNLVEMMNGTIGVESEKGVGSCFTVTITVKASGRSRQQPSGSDLPEQFRAIVVDDDEVACKHAQLVLNDLGVEADICRDSEEADQLIRSQACAGRPYYLALIDYRMPKLDGLDLCRKIREHDHGFTSIIILSGYNLDDMMEEALQAGADSILSKPLFTDTLLHEIQGVLRKKDYSQESVSVQESSPMQEKPEFDLEGRIILLAEDVDINAEIITDLLDIEGASTERAKNGKIAVEMFADSEENYYDAIFMDMRMPVMDGLTAARLIRGLDRTDAQQIPIIALTANAFEEDVQRSMQAGMDAHLSKPVDPDHLYTTLEKLIASRKTKR